jgi:hypothetical protein
MLTHAFASHITRQAVKMNRCDYGIQNPLWILRN